MKHVWAMGMLIAVAVCGVAQAAETPTFSDARVESGKRYRYQVSAVDAKGNAQPMPRPFRKSGRCDIEEIKLTVG